MGIAYFFRQLFHVLDFLLGEIKENAYR